MTRKIKTKEDFLNNSNFDIRGDWILNINTGVALNADMINKKIIHINEVINPNDFYAEGWHWQSWMFEKNKLNIE